LPHKRFLLEELDVPMAAGKINLAKYFVTLTVVMSHFSKLMLLTYRLNAQEKFISKLLSLTFVLNFITTRKGGGCSVHSSQKE
jgi:hypothetical protein